MAHLLTCLSLQAPKICRRTLSSYRLLSCLQSIPIRGSDNNGVPPGTRHVPVSGAKPSPTAGFEESSTDLDSCPLLEEKYSKLKQSIVKPEHKTVLIESYHRLTKALEKEANRIEQLGPRAIPEIDFSEIESNSGRLPDGLIDIVRQTGCVILRGVVPEEQATKWEDDLKAYTKKHPKVSGYPKNDPQSFSLFWTKPQVEIRSHPRVLKAMQAMSRMWHLSRDDSLFDMGSQVAYADRFRIRHPSRGMSKFNV